MSKAALVSLASISLWIGYVLVNVPREVRCYFYPEKIEWYFLGRKVYSEASLNSRKFPLSSLFFPDNFIGPYPSL